MRFKRKSPEIRDPAWDYRVSEGKVPTTLEEAYDAGVRQGIRIGFTWVPGESIPDLNPFRTRLEE